MIKGRRKGGKVDIKKEGTWVVEGNGNGRGRRGKRDEEGKK